MTLATTHFASFEHDLRQPLHAAQMFVDAMRTRLNEDPSSLHILGLLERSIRTSQSMLSGLSDASLIDGGHLEPEIQLFDANEVVADVCDQSRPFAEEKGIELRVVTQYGLALTYSDPQLLRRMVQNLVSNAIKFTESGGVLVGIRRRQGSFVIEVWDTGSGIPEAQQSQVFDQFFQANQDQDRDRGLGLGLANVRHLAALLGHEVELRSREGLGSVFAISVDDANKPRTASERPAMRLAS